MAAGAAPKARTHSRDQASQLSLRRINLRKDPPDGGSGIAQGPRRFLRQDRQLTQRAPVSAPIASDHRPFSASSRGQRFGGLPAALRGRRLVYVIVVAGGVLRLSQYLANTSLSLDESLLALNLRHKSFSQLFDQLDFNQAAPPGFLVVQKAAVALLGDGEYALRAFPLVASLASIVLFPLLARMILDETMTVVATALFAVAGAVVDYAATGKQYGVDVFAVVLLSWLGLRAVQRRRSADVALVTVAGFLAVWISHPAAFVVFAVGVTLIAQALASREPRRVVVTAAICLAWFGSFGAAYALSRVNVQHIQESLRGSTAFVTAAHPGAAPTYFGLFRYAAGVPHVTAGGRDLGDYIAALAGILFVVGITWLLLRDLPAATVLYLPIAVAVFVSLFDKYPLIPRTTLFAAPAGLIGIAAGTGALTKHRTHRGRLTVGVVATVAIGLTMGVVGAWRLANPQRDEEMKPVLRYLARSERPSDTIYLLYTSQYAFRYYLECGCFDAVTAPNRSRGIWPLTRYPGDASQWAPALESRSPRFIVGTYDGRDAERYVAAISRLKGRARVWVVISDIPSRQRESLLLGLDKFGRRLASFRSHGDESSGGAYLYDLRG